MRRAGSFLIVVSMVAAAATAHAEGLRREALRIPMAAAGPRGLEALLVRPDDQKRYPLALISHGAPRDAADRPDMSPNRYDLQAVEFARRGFAALVVMRRGYGTSDGAFTEGSGPCNAPDYPAAARASLGDLRAAIAAMGERRDISLQGMIAVGQSAGGFATVALTADPPPGLVAAINFAGGRGSIAPGKVCDEAKLIEAFGKFGAKSRVPMLWLYADNDQFFSPALARQFHQAFTAAGGQAQLIAMPPFGSDGHSLFASGPDIWTPPVDRFLKQQHLGSTEPLPAPALPDIPPPPQLSARGREAFTSYLKGGWHKAFAVAPNGSYAWRTGRRSAEDAKTDVLEACGENASGCRVYAVDDALAETKR